jgi:hypothetical protein
VATYKTIHTNYGHAAIASADDPERAIVVVPQSPIGALIVRGQLGTPGAYIPGEIDPESGEQLWIEVEPPTVWPGYHCELYADSVPEALEPYVVVDTDE